MSNSKNVSIKFVPVNINDRAPLVIDVPNAKTERDRELVDGFLASGLCITVFENCGTKSYKKAHREVAVKTEDGELVVEKDCWITESKKEAALREYVVCLEPCQDFDYYDDDLQHELKRIIKKRSDVCAIPNGKLFEKFVSELSITPIMNGDEFNFDNTNILAHLENMCVTEEGKGEEYQESLKEKYKGTFVIYHEETGVSLSYDPDSKHPFDGTSLNVDFHCDSLYLGLIFKFSWAVDECDYGSEQEVAVCTRWDND